MVPAIRSVLIIFLVNTQHVPLVHTHYTNYTGHTEASYTIDFAKEERLNMYDAFYEVRDPHTIEEDESHACVNFTCVRKCCAQGKYFSIYPEYGCFPIEKMQPKFELVFRRENGQPTHSEKPVWLLHWPDFKNCSAYGLLPEHREAVLLGDGRLYTAHEDMYRDTSKYCIDVIQRDTKKFSMWFVTCYDKYEEATRSKFQMNVHTTCLVLSSVSLLVIIVCHVTLPKLRDLSGLCLLSHVTSLFIADICLITVTLNRNISMNFCVFLGVAIHSSLLSTYMWLTAMCFDIWRYVRMSVKGIPSHILQQQERRLYACYCVVVWGAILVITCTTCTLHFLPQEALPDYVIRPHFGVNRCFIIDGDLNLLLYFFSILAVLCVLNVSFVGKTVHYLYEGGAKICCFQKTTLTAGPTTFNNKYLDVFWQRLQMFLMTTIVWTTEVLSWKIPPKEMWDVTDVLNTLQGVIVLFIFLRPKRKRRLILAKIRSLLGRTQTVERKLNVSQSEVTVSTISASISRGSTEK